MPAVVSSPVLRMVAHQGRCGDLTGERYSGLLAHLAALPDPRRRRGRRHRLGAVLAVAVCAVLTGAKSLAAIGEWAADAPAEVLAALGVRPDPLSGVVRAPDEATVRRVLAGVDADALDTAIGAWLLELHPAPPAPRVEPPTPRQPWRAVAVDGKTLRGSGRPGGQVHLLAVMDHCSRAVLGQVEVAGKSNEITAFRPLLHGVDLARTVVTADALSRGRDNASYAEVFVMPRWSAVTVVEAVTVVVRSA